MPQVLVPVLHREGLLGPPPTQLDVVVDLAWCDVRTVAVTDTAFDRFGTPRTERLFLTATDTEWARFFGCCPRPCFARCAERCSGCGCAVRLLHSGAAT